MSGFSRPVGIGGIDFSKWTSDEIIRLVQVANSVLNERKTFDEYYDVYKTCSDLHHRPPLGNMIPVGQTHDHTCPSCGKKPLY